MTKTKLIALGLWLAGHCAFAQISPDAYGYYTEALRYSQTQFGGSARFQGLAGAATALGGDITAAYANPAGLGFNRKNEISFSPSLRFMNSGTKFQGETTEDYNTNFNFNHFGMSFKLDADPEANWRGKTFAITFSRLNDYNSNISYSGINNQNTLVDVFLENADGIPWREKEEEINSEITSLTGLAYDAYLINPDLRNPSQNTYASFAFDQPGVPGSQLPDIRQQETIKRRGAHNQYNISYGANYRDFFFLGASVGVQRIRFEQEKRYSETVLSSNTPMQSFTLQETLTQRGTGFNISIGAIVKPVEALRFGVNIVTPTITSLSEVYNASLEADYNNYRLVDENGNLIREFGNDNPITSSTVMLEDTYALTTPFRLNLGAALFAGKMGFVSGDVEFVNYGAARLSSSRAGTPFAGDNQTIQNIFHSAVNLRLGAEARLGDFRLRAGAGYYQNPKYENVDLGRDGLVLNGGVGMHTKKYYIDFVLKSQAFNDTYAPYTLSRGGHPMAEIANRRTGGTVSIGLFF